MGQFLSKENTEVSAACTGAPVSKVIGPEESGQETYYGVYIPPDEHVEAEGIPHVYADKMEALKIIKKFKKARFKPFKREDEALEFVQHGPNISVISPGPATDGGEKPSLFRAPKSQESSCLRRCIEQGDIAVVKATIWENPRYLVSSGDTPAIMKEGPRYNALHIAAKAGNAQMCNMLLNTVGDPAYLALLYGEDNPDSCKDRARILLDLYLNTPDKGTNETPLHFAAKFGAVEVVQVLVSYLQCDKKLKNKWGQSPKDIVCSRVSNPGPGVKNDILSLLTDRFYVPILRSEDNSVQPIVGEVFAPECPPVLSNDPLLPRVEIKAYAGPMDRDQAAVFRKKWKTPPRILSMNGAQNASLDRCSGSPVSHNYRLLDSEKGLERVGRCLANQLSVGWKEYWGFLKTFTNLSSPDGLQRLDEFLRLRFQQQAKAEHELSSKFNGSDDQMKDSSLHLIKTSPISDLCDAFGACSLSESAPSRYVKINSLPAVLKRREVVVDECGVLGSSSSRLSYIEKSSQVFAKRIYDGLVHMSVIGRVQNMKELVLDVLKPEVEHLQSLVGSYMLDDRFSSFNFQRIHSRISTIVAEKLCSMLVDDLDFITISLQSILAKGVDSSSSGEDDDDSVNSSTTHRKQKVFVKKQPGQANCQVRCISECILKALNKLSTEDAVNGEDTPPKYEDAWSSAENCLCCWETTSFLRNSRKMSSLKRNQAKKFAVNKGNTAIEESSKKTESDEDECGFYTPPASPELAARLSESEPEEEATLAVEAPEVFIEGNNLSKLDILVLQAIEDCDLINPADFPYVYRWRHSVLLHPQEERAQLLTPKGRSIGRHLGGGSPWSVHSELDSPVKQSAPQALPRQLLF